MNFIELTSVQGKKTIINADRISSVCPSELSGGVILVVNEGAFYFRESYSRLKEMLLPFYEVNFGGTNGELNCANGEE